MSLPRPLKGIVPPLATPLDASGHLDAAGLERLVEHVLRGGVSGVFVLGTTGEGASFPPARKHEVVERVVRQVRGRAAVLVGVTDTCVSKGVELARHSARAGADAVVVSAPYYLPLEQGELEGWARGVVKAQPLPVFLYNYPELTGTAYEVETVRRLAEVERVVGIKDSSGDLGYLLELRRAVTRQDFSVLVGIEELLVSAVRAGVDGAVAGGALIVPGLLTDLYKAAVNGDARRCAALEERVRLLGKVYRIGPGPTAVVRGIKGALASLGICSARMAEPYRACSEQEMREIASVLAQLSAGRGDGGQRRATT